MPEPLPYPGVFIEELAAPPAITGVSTSVTLFVGWAARGRTDAVVPVTSVVDYEREFGGLDTRSLLGYAVMQFFANGGTQAQVLRLAHADAQTAACALGGLECRARSPGEWAQHFALRAVPTDAPGGTHFRLEISDLQAGGTVVEAHDALSLDPADARFAPTAINAVSAILAVSVTAGSTELPEGRVYLGRTRAQLAPSTPIAAATHAGSDGTVLVPGSEAFNARLLADIGDDARRDGLPPFNLLAVPGLTHVATLAALQAHCRRLRAFLIADAEPSARVSDLLGTGLAGLRGNDASFAALYHPWVLAPDPLAGGTPRSFPPSGFVAGVIARTDRSRGVWKAPAGTDARLQGATGLSQRLTDVQAGQLNPQGIDCLRSLPNQAPVVWGARTLQGQDDSASEWKYIPVRRLALYIEDSLNRGLGWAVFEPNDEPLWARLRLSVGDFMHQLFRQGALQGTSPRDACFVRCDRTTMTGADIASGVAVVLVGFAPLKPAEFVVLTIRLATGSATA